jgi:hypothetical protein
MTRVFWLDRIEQWIAGTSGALLLRPVTKR